jgi:hypothetical protein
MIEKRLSAAVVQYIQWRACARELAASSYACPTVKKEFD